MNRTRYVIANWKQNPSSFRQARAIFSGTARRLARTKKGIELVVCPPMPFLKPLFDGYRGRRILFGAQTVSAENGGAHTGEVSVAQIKDAGARYVVLGHSEQRAKGETSRDVSLKVEAAVLGGVHPIVCIGETKRDEGAEYLSVVSHQLKESLGGVGRAVAEHIVIAYEPVWAIGGEAGDALKPHDMHQMVLYIRKVLIDLWGQDGARTSILYGGSVKASNAAEMVREGAVDGFLVGSASLDPEEFANIVLKVQEYGN